ncbi:uncharacterized protein LOC129674769 [Psammomys obesus]|uniref:uncharacterized protein LOC129674769 n=1 Tax=Psammomys obesus TaxID=48139 RepID=UPI0024536E7E|nr:uncharacterized protein LOC129674769 [Psammomys obesus]
MTRHTETHQEPGDAPHRRGPHCPCAGSQPHPSDTPRNSEARHGQEGVQGSTPLTALTAPQNHAHDAQEPRQPTPWAHRLPAHTAPQLTLRQLTELTRAPWHTRGTHAPTPHASLCERPQNCCADRQPGHRLHEARPSEPGQGQRPTPLTPLALHCQLPVPIPPAVPCCHGDGEADSAAEEVGPADQACRHGDEERRRSPTFPLRNLRSAEEADTGHPPFSLPTRPSAPAPGRDTTRGLRGLTHGR